MRIARFGDAYATAYTFSATLMDDSWQSMRPPIMQDVSGANGVFDYYGSNNYPINPVVASKKFAITGTSSADLEDSLITLRAATIATDRSKLWWLDRDNSTYYWAWAKCTRLNTSDTYKESGRWVKNVDIEFYMTEGVWYGAVENSESGTWTITHPSDTEIVEVTNSGNIPALVAITLTPSGLAINPVGAQIRDGVSGTPYSQWQFNAAVTTGHVFICNARTYVCLNHAIDAYTSLDVGDATLIGSDDIDQVAWLWIPSGTHNCYLKCETADDGSASFGIKWWDTYVF